MSRAGSGAVQTGGGTTREALDCARRQAVGWRAVAIGGGAVGGLWPQLGSDVTGRAQDIPEQNLGACYGDALLAATATGMVPDGTDWTKLTRIIHPRPELADLYDRRYALYRELYTVTRPLIDRL